VGIHSFGLTLKPYHIVYNNHFIYREHNDIEVGTETVHQIKGIHIPENSGNPYNTSGQKTDLAMIELVDSVNTCTEKETQDGLCWTITPVRLPDPFIYIKPLQEVRTLGKHIHTNIIGFYIDV
jgi:hypothetical protein